MRDTKTWHSCRCRYVCRSDKAELSYMYVCMLSLRCPARMQLTDESSEVQVYGIIRLLLLLLLLLLTPLLYAGQGVMNKIVLVHATRGRLMFSGHLKASCTNGLDTMMHCICGPCTPAFSSDVQLVGLFITHNHSSLRDLLCLFLLLCPNILETSSVIPQVLLDDSDTNTRAHRQADEMHNSNTRIVSNENFTNPQLMEYCR